MAAYYRRRGAYTIVVNTAGRDLVGPVLEILTVTVRAATAGIVTIGASMQEVFVFNEIAVIIRHWYEIGANGREHGARVEIRLLTPSPRRGDESASQLIAIDQPIWRADLFDLLGDEPGTFGRAHYHHTFDGVEPTARDWDPELSADPISWCREQLSNLEKVIAASGATLIDPALEAVELRAALRPHDREREPLCGQELS